MVNYAGPEIEFNYKESTLRITLDSNHFAPDSTRDQRRKEVEKMIKNLQGRRGAITRLKAELHHLTARESLPIPYELLVLIFQYSVHSHGQLPERLLLVCRTFYVVTINCRALWTDLDPVGQSTVHHLPRWAGTFIQSTVHHLPRWAGTFIQSRVARSNPIPLAIDFTNFPTLEMTDEFAKKVAGIPTLLQRCRSVVISRASELQFFQGFQPFLESLNLEVRYVGHHSKYRPWESVGECPNLRSLTLRTSKGRENWPDHLFQQLTHLEIKMPLQKGINSSYHHDILPLTVRLRSLILMVDFGVPQPVIHKSLQTLVLVYRIPWMVEVTNTLGEIVCPELRRLEIRAPYSELLPSIRLRHTQKLSDLCLVCRQGITYNEEDASFLNEKWSDSIVELLRSIGTIKHLKVESGIEVVSVLVEKLEADSTLCPDLVSLHAEPLPPVSSARTSKRERSLLLKLESRVSERYQQLRRE